MMIVMGVEAKRRGRGGFTLLEMLIYTGVLLVVLAAALDAFYTSMETYRGLKRNSDQITAALNAGERWRADVRTGSVRPLEGNVLDPRWTGIMIEGGTNSVWYAQDERSIWRSTDDGASWQMILPDVKTSLMTRVDAERVVPWRWTIELESSVFRPRVRPLFEFVAVSGGSEGGSNQ